MMLTINSGHCFKCKGEYIPDLKCSHIQLYVVVNTDTNFFFPKQNICQNSALKGTKTQL
jgi:hypothetical protein